MFTLAGAVENYAVDIGYAYAGTRDPAWKNELRDKGFAYLRNTRYHFGDDPEDLFEFEFIDKLAWAFPEVRPTRSLGPQSSSIDGFWRDERRRAWGCLTSCIAIG